MKIHSEFATANIAKHLVFLVTLALYSQAIRCHTKNVNPKTSTSKLVGDKDMDLYMRDLMIQEMGMKEHSPSVFCGTKWGKNTHSLPKYSLKDKLKPGPTSHLDPCITYFVQELTMGKEDTKRMKELQKHIPFIHMYSPCFKDTKDIYVKHAVLLIDERQRHKIEWNSDRLIEEYLLLWKSYRVIGPFDLLYSTYTITVEESRIITNYMGCWEQLEQDNGKYAEKEYEWTSATRNWKIVV